MSTTFRKKPLDVEIMSWPGGERRADAVLRWVRENGGTARYIAGHPGNDRAPGWVERIVIDAPEGTLTARPGDVVVQEPSGQFVPMASEVMLDTHDMVAGGRIRAQFAAAYDREVERYQGLAFVACVAGAFTVLGTIIGMLVPTW